MAALLVSLMLMLATAGVSDGAWCVCRSDVSDSALQKTLDYACGAGADCTTIQQGGGCFNPNTVRAHCSYAANSYFQKKGQAQQACDFSGTATVSSSDPSSNGCSYPASASSAGTSTNSNTPITNNSPGSSSSTSGGSTPNSFTSPTSGGGVMGGTGLGPSGNSITDTSHAAAPPMPSLLLVVLFMLI